MKILLFTLAAGTAGKASGGYSDFALTLLRTDQVPLSRNFSVLLLIRFQKEDHGNHHLRIVGYDSRRVQVVLPSEFDVTIPGKFPENLFGGYDVFVSQETTGNFRDYGRYNIELSVSGALKAEWPLDIVPVKG